METHTPTRTRIRIRYTSVITDSILERTIPNLSETMTSTVSELMNVTVFFDVNVLLL